MYTETTIKLTEMSARSTGEVTAIDPPDDDMIRLMAMGICIGRIVEVVQSGNPLIVRVYGSRIGVSRRLAERIHLVPLERPSCPLN